VFERLTAGRREIHTMQTDGSDLVPVTTNAVDSRSPDWQRRLGPQSPGGLVTLPGGARPIPATSVAPAQLMLSAPQVRPHPRRPGAPLVVRMVVRDSRGYVVRGARVTARTAPASRTRRALPSRSRLDGSAAPWLDPRGRSARLVVVVTATAPSVTVSKRCAVRPG
jgi:hypothetical protein